MKVLACLPTYGAGTPNVESFASILRRTAEAYDVGFTHVVSLLGRVADRKKRAIYRGYLHASNFYGWLPVTEMLVTSMERLTGKPSYARHTLLKVREVFSENSGGFFAPIGRWCPVCLDPERGVEYELLAHSLTDVVSCPLHGTTLLSACLACGTKRSIRSDGPQQRWCRQCGDALWTQRVEAPVRDAESLWRETQVLRLVAYCSDDTQLAPDANWVDRVREGHAALAYTPERVYSKAERFFFSTIIRGGLRFQPKTLFRFAAIQSVDVVDLLMQPEACCSPRLPTTSPIRQGRTRRCARLDKALAAKEALETLMTSDPSQLLPGLLPVCLKHGLNGAAFYQKFPEAYLNYGIERRRRQLLRVSATSDAALTLARRILSEERSTEFTVRLLGKRISEATGAAKHLAEEAARGALRGLRNSSSVPLEPRRN